MSSIYDNKKNAELLDGGKTSPQAEPMPQYIKDMSEKLPLTMPEDAHQNMGPIEDTLANRLNKELVSYQERSQQAMQLVDDIVLKNYLTKLKDMDVIPCEEQGINNIIIFKINKMVYEKDEYATDKFVSIVSAMTYTNSSIYLIIDGHKSRTDFYMGIKCEDEERQKSTIAETFKNSLLGQFPGAEVEDFSYVTINSERSRQEKLLHRLSEAVSYSSCVVVPSYKNSKEGYTNENFIQGVEKFAYAMQGKEYTAVILATSIPNAEIQRLRLGYENLYTELSAISTRQLAYSTNESLANAVSRSKGTSLTQTDTHSTGTSTSTTDTDTHTVGKSHATNNVVGCSFSQSVGGSVSGSASIMGIGGSMSTFTATTVGANYSHGITNGTNSSDSHAHAVTNGTQESLAKGISTGETFTETNGETTSIGSSKNFTITLQNKHIIEIQKRIDKQLERIEMCEGTGLWSTGAYFMSYETDRSIAETGATIFRSIIQGEQSGIENSAINTWYHNDNEQNYKKISSYVSSLSHPIFKYENIDSDLRFPVSSTALLSSKELSMMIGLPRKSVPGLPVIEHVSLAKEVVRLSESNNHNTLKLGHIYDQGTERKENLVRLDVKSLTQHTFVTGSTGCGKSNTIYYLIKQIRNQANAPKFLVIEPAKGEYKDVFGNEHIYGTNPIKTPLLKINPFRFPEGVHVLEHIDRLIEIFNVCWPMYAAMPAVLKEAILNSYEDCGWDLSKSINKFSNELFPTFSDLLQELVYVINNSAYSDEVKSNYQGSLVTRVKSLNNGICKDIFTDKELGDKALFDENVIIDLSRIGSQETKSLIMGILIMRLNEYRANSGISHNSDLRHITILEEAHNILKPCSQEQSLEGSNVAGKSVEMISNSIAEMRTYGEGFIIVDQSPGAVDISAIRNTNTKIIMRLPEDSDRKVAGKASGMKDNQIDEIAKLPTGVAVVYQNDWEEPVLCKIGKFEDKEIAFEYIYQNDGVKDNESSIATIEILKLLLKGRVASQIDVNVDAIVTNLSKEDISTHCKICIYELLNEYRKNHSLRIWNDNNFESLSRLVTNILSAQLEVKRLAATIGSFEELTDSLSDLVDEKVDGLSDELKLVTSQCLMRDYSLCGDVAKKVYNAWFQTVKLSRF